MLQRRVLTQALSEIRYGTTYCLTFPNTAGNSCETVGETKDCFLDETRSTLETKFSNYQDVMMLTFVTFAMPIPKSLSPCITAPLNGS